MLNPTGGKKGNIVLFIGVDLPNAVSPKQYGNVSGESGELLNKNPQI